jgi:tRNA(Ile)-lysidine synthetase-like protein
MTDKVLLPPGKYVVAVSGGVDSVVLLHMLSLHNELELVVAHYDHGIRSDSAADAAFVQELAKNYGFEYVTDSGNLGADASEAEARNKRYKFLQSVKQKTDAKAIVTAHHQDDVIETSMINLLRGTGRHGITALKNRPDIIRPLLEVPKSEILNYAKEQNITWHEDSTNTDTKYLRNKLRLDILPKMTIKQRHDWLAMIAGMQKINENLDVEIQQVMRRGRHKGQHVVNRAWFIKLPHVVAKEVVVVLLQELHAKDIDKKSVERIVVQIKTLPHGKVIQTTGIDVVLTKRSARFKLR